jgi:hypothetical protein
MATFSHLGNSGFDAAEIDIFTSTSDSTIVLSILCANISASPTDVTLRHENASSVLINYVADAIAIPASSSLELLSNKYIMPSGNKFTIETSVSGSLSYSLSYVEV